MIIILLLGQPYCSFSIPMSVERAAHGKSDSGMFPASQS